MEGRICIIEKPKKQPISPSNLEKLKPYVVVSVNTEYDGAEVGDIVLRLPTHFNSGFEILNCTKQRICHFRDKNYPKEFSCERAFHIQEIKFCYDAEDRPNDGAK